MRLAFKIALLAGGMGLIAWSAKPLGLLLFGEKTDGVIVDVMNSSVTTQSKGTTRPVPTGLFLVDTHVRYIFDVNPTPVEALQRLSDAPLAKDVVGTDTLHGTTRFADVAKYSAGDPVRVIFLKALPSFNSAYQPKNMAVGGTLRLLGGLAMSVWGWRFASRKPLKPAKAQRSRSRGARPPQDDPM